MVLPMQEATSMVDSKAVPGQPVRVLLAKVGLDGHDRGVRVVARALKEAGMEVIYTGLHRSPEEVVATAVQEDVDVIGVSLLSGAHMTLFPQIVDALRARGVVDRHILIGGGVMPDDDVEALRELGVSAILGQDTPPEAIAMEIEALVAEKRVREA
jgi:2-hydroxyisobutanoyl-CoA mutase small subunit